MKESDLIARTDEAFGRPVNFRQICRDLEKIGVRKGETLLVHSSLSAVGWITGGAETLIRALLAVVGKSGTLVMPAHSGALSDPVLWENPPVPASWNDSIREEMPAFDKGLTPTRGIGVVPELFRRFPGVIRSSHPMDSFAVFGPEAEKICRTQKLENGLGEGSPLAHIYDLDGRVLLIGCAYDKNTSLHLAEYRARWPGKKHIRQGCPVSENGKRVWTWFEELDLDTEDFSACGKAFEETQTALSGGCSATVPVLKPGNIGLADSRLMSQPALVDFAAEWFSAHRGSSSEKNKTMEAII